MLLFNSRYNAQFPELQGSSAEQLMQSLTELAIESVIRPIVSSRSVRQAELYALLKSTATCNSPKELAKILRQCPDTGSLILEENTSLTRKCSSCSQPLVRTVAHPANIHADVEEDGIGDEAALATACFTSHIRVQHLTEPDTQSVKLLFQDHQRFLFFFERVAELYIQQRRNNPEDIKDLLYHLINDTRLRVSWRFLTVVMSCL